MPILTRAGHRRHVSMPIMSSILPWGTVRLPAAALNLPGPLPSSAARVGGGQTRKRRRTSVSPLPAELDAARTFLRTGVLGSPLQRPITRRQRIVYKRALLDKSSADTATAAAAAAAAAAASASKRTTRGMTRLRHRRPPLTNRRHTKRVRFAFAHAAHDHEHQHHAARTTQHHTDDDYDTSTDDEEHAQQKQQGHCALKSMMDSSMAKMASFFQDMAANANATEEEDTDAAAAASPTMQMSLHPRAKQSKQQRDDRIDNTNAAADDDAKKKKTQKKTKRGSKRSAFVPTPMQHHHHHRRKRPGRPATAPHSTTKEDPALAASRAAAIAIKHAPAATATASAAPPHFENKSESIESILKRAANGQLGPTWRTANHQFNHTDHRGRRKTELMRNRISKAAHFSQNLRKRRAAGLRPTTAAVANANTATPLQQQQQTTRKRRNFALSARLTAQVKSVPPCPAAEKMQRRIHSTLVKVEDAQQRRRRKRKKGRL